MPDETVVTEGGDGITDSGAAGDNANASAATNWQAKFYGLQGSFKQYKKEVAEEKGRLLQVIESLKEKVAEKDAEIAALRQQVEDLGGKLSEVDSLKEQMSSLQQKAELADKYAVLVDYPDLLGLRVEETVQGEDGSEQVVTANPAIRLIESSTLTGDELRQVLDQMVKAMPLTPGEAAKKQQRQPLAGATPSPAAPAVSNKETEEAIHKRISELHTRANRGERYTDTGKDILEEISDLYRQLRELQS